MPGAPSAHRANRDRGARQSDLAARQYALENELGSLGNDRPLSRRSRADAAPTSPKPGGEGFAEKTAWRSEHYPRRMW